MIDDQVQAFLNARLDEDEAAAKRAEGATGRGEPRKACSPWIAAGSLLLALQPDRSHEDIAEVMNYGLDDILKHAARHDPARVLRKVEAQRRIVNDLAQEANFFDLGNDAELGVHDRDTNVDPLLGDMLLRALASAYSDHPDYRQEWKS